MIKLYISECEDGGYIREKTCVPCQGYCLKGEHCNKLSGRCDNGCQNYWHGNFCEGPLNDFFINEFQRYNTGDDEYNILISITINKMLLS